MIEHTTVTLIKYINIKYNKNLNISNCLFVGVSSSIPHIINKNTPTIKPATTFNDIDNTLNNCTSYLIKIKFKRQSTTEDNVVNIFISS